ncbi:MAG: Crp/Fnr family transcriptional regulator [Saprospiraceae bacterium]|nr:Crp/Fnr family transcriptional regulator [Saprospiraceae bacterium]
MNKQSLQSLLRKRFPTLGDESLAAFLNICEYRAVKKKEIILPAGSAQRTAFYVLEGFVRGILTGENNKERNLMLRMEGSFNLSVNQLMEAAPGRYGFEAISACKLLVFSFEAFEALAQTHADFGRLYVNILKENILILQSRVDEMATKQPEQRYLTLLEQNPAFFQSAFNKHIANFLGITPVSLSRIRKRIYDKYKNRADEPELPAM